MITCQEKPKIGVDTVLAVNVKLKTFKCEQVGQVKSSASETENKSDRKGIEDGEVERLPSSSVDFEAGIVKTGFVEV